MITRIYLENCLSFKSVDLEFKGGLNIFTGPSGAGKSILMEEILSLFAINDVKSQLAEVSLYNFSITDHDYNISINSDIIIKSIKKDKTRYLLNNQSISKKNLYDFSTKLIKHLNLRETTEFKSENLVSYIDKLCQLNNIQYSKIKEEFISLYTDYTQTKKELHKIIEDEKNLEELKEYLRFEIEKIEQINPKIHEYEDLKEIKKKLAKKEKLEAAINKASGILEFNNSVNKVLELMEIDSSFFDETMNELRNIFEKYNDMLSELEDLNIEHVFDKIEKLSSLIKRFGSIDECLIYKEEKIKELEEYNNITFKKETLEKKLSQLSHDIEVLSLKISKIREKNSIILEEKINYYLKFLYLSNAKIVFNAKPIDITGGDEIKFVLNQVSLETISSGEYNRLRLAFLTSVSELDIGENGILFLDEIDANLSGKESEAIAKVLKKLSSTFQIFAISHQTQLSSCANQHFLVDKNHGVSTVKILNENERVRELARMISGHEITSEAIHYAQNLLANKD